jgi:hypothetical protein
MEVLKKVGLDGLAGQLAKPDTQQTDGLPLSVELVEQLFSLGDQFVVIEGIGYGHLAGGGLKVGVTDLYGDTAGRLVLLPQLIPHPFGHADEFGHEKGDIGLVLLEGILGRDRFGLMIGDHFALVDALRLVPELDAIFAKAAFQLLYIMFAQVADRFDPQLLQGQVGLLPHPGYLIDLQRGQELFFPSVRHLDIAIRLGLVGGDLGDHLIGSQREGNGQFGLVHDLLPQIDRPLIGVEETVHPGEVEIEFIDGRLLQERGLCRDDLGHPAGIFAVGAACAAVYRCVRAETHSSPHGHGRMDAVFAGLIATGRHYPAIAMTADEQGQPLERWVEDTFHRDEKGVEIEMDDGARRRHDAGGLVLVAGAKILNKLVRNCREMSMAAADDRGESLIFSGWNG